MEEPFFFENEGTRIAAMLHRPPENGKGVSTRGGLVFCPPYADEAFKGHRELVAFARQLAALGFAVLRFDYRGTGDSEGDLGDFSLADRRSDIQAAIDVLERRAGTSRLGVLGLRLGGMLGAVVAADDGRVGSLVIWSPLTSKPFLRTLQWWYVTRQLMHRQPSGRDALVNELQAGRPVDLSGSWLTPTVYQEALEMDTWMKGRRFQGRVLLVGFKGDAANRASIDALHPTYYPEAQVEWVSDKPFWLNKRFHNPVSLYQATADWIDLAFG